MLSTWFGHAVSDDAFVMPIAAAPVAMAAGIAMRASSRSTPRRSRSSTWSSLAPPRCSPSSPSCRRASQSCHSCCSRTASPGHEASSRPAASGFALEAQARKAQHFVDEFENSGRGWFWETEPLGTLSYVSQQLAEDFQCEPEELLGRQFTDLLSVDTERRTRVEERKTLGFHLSARFPFSDVVVRPASQEDVHWSLSGNPIFDERGRFLGFRGIGTDLTEQRRSEQEISRLARFDSLTGLPEPGDDAPDAR